jgi:hypothetical protein
MHVISRFDHYPTGLLMPNNLASALCVLLAGAAATASAHNFCVTDAADLQADLTAASDGGAYNGEDNILQVERNTYSTHSNGDNRFYYYSTANHYLDIQGGWSDGCTQMSVDPTKTILDGHGDSAVVELHSTQGSIDIRYVTIQNGFSPDTALAAGLNINAHGSDLGVALVVYSIIRNNVSTSMPGGIEGGIGGIYVTNNLIEGNSSGGDGGAGLIVAPLSPVPSGLTAFITNNTVVGNTTTSATGAGGLVVSDSGITGYVVNNIFRGNTRSDLELLGSAAVLIDNDYAVLGGDGSPASGSTGNITSNPQFVDAASGNYRLAGNSPALAAGATQGNFNVPYYDLQGHSRPTGLCPIDMGAYEETIFIGGFD